MANAADLGRRIPPINLPSLICGATYAKIKASGFNTVTFYFDWGYHSPKQGELDFTGIRDMDAPLPWRARKGFMSSPALAPM
jgi:beta-galactosidase GanA